MFGNNFEPLIADTTLKLHLRGALFPKSSDAKAMGCYIHAPKTVTLHNVLKDTSANSRSTNSNFNDLFLLERMVAEG